MKLYALNEIAGELSRITGKSISSHWTSTCLKQIDPAKKYPPSKRFTSEQFQTVLVYTLESHKKRIDLTILEWLEKNGKPIPKPYAPYNIKSVPLKLGGFSRRDLEHMVDRAVAKRLKEIEVAALLPDWSEKPAGKMESTQGELPL